MNKTIILMALFVSCMFLLTGCIREQTRLSYTITGCNVKYEQDLPAKRGIEPVEIMKEGGGIKITHDLSYLCCANITVEWEKAQNEINITESNIGERCRCVCTYNVSITISPLEKGKYLVKLFGVKDIDRTPELIIEKEVEV